MKIRHAIIGYGSAGTVHSRVIENLTQVTLTAICDLCPQQIQLAKINHPEVRFYTNIDEMYEDIEVDSVSICTPHNTHASLSMNSIRRGIHVLCEKPIATKISDAEEMVKNAELNNVVLGTIFQHRFEYAPALLKKEIDQGLLGDVISTSISVKWKKDPKYYKSWKGDYQKAGGGVTINQAIHMIDLAAWLNGGISSVYANTKISRDFINVEDNAVAVIEYSNGAIGAFDMSTSTEPFLGTGIEVVGSKYTVSLFEGRIMKWGAKTHDEIEKLNSIIDNIDANTWGKKYFGYGHIYQIEDFIDAIIGKRRPLITGEQGIETLKVVLAISNSNSKGSKVHIQ